MEVVSSTYDFKQSDYASSYGNLKGGKITKKNTDEALIAVCKEMLKRIKNPIKQPNVSRVTKNVLSVFNQIGKTIIFCHSLKQSNAIYNSLNGFNELTGKVLISHSENDTDSENFIKFKDNDSYSILIAVDRGKLGFNIPELFNVVDFTLTQSLDMLMQMYGRLLRLSKTNNPKTYYKVATKNTASYYVDLMTAMLCLTDMEWYSKYNGKNMGGILIPKVLSNTKRKSKSYIAQPVKKSSKPKVSLADLDIPLDMNLFKTAYRNDGDKFGTIAWTTLNDCRREFYNLGHDSSPKWNNESIKNEALKYKTKSDFIKNNRSCYNAGHKLGIIDKVCSHMDAYYSEWTDDEIREVAKLYKQRSHFNKGPHHKAYRAAYGRGILDKVCSHMESPFINWDESIIKKQALKYTKRVDFQYKSKAAYRAANRLGILDKVCSHMKRPAVWNKK